MLFFIGSRAFGKQRFHVDRLIPNGAKLDRTNSPSRPLPPDQDQRDRETIWENNLDSCLVRVRAGKGKAVPAARARLRYAVVPERAQEPALRIDARGEEADLRAKPITESKIVKSVIEKFREKYGAADVKNYYYKFDVAVVVEMM
jgi:hypothetical protein